MILPLLLSALLQAGAASTVAAQFQSLEPGDDQACTADGRWCVGLVEGAQGDERTVRPLVRAGGSAPTGATGPSATDAKPLRPGTV